LVTYFIRQEFEPDVDLANSSILGHDDYEPLHPGIPYTAQIKLGDDTNGWQDIQYVQVALGGNFDDDESSMFISLAEGDGGAAIQPS